MQQGFEIEEGVYFILNSLLVYNRINKKYFP